MKFVWLLQLGTLEKLTVKACRAYLREFLMDERVIDLPFLPRWLLVNGIIAPFRAPKSLEAYRSIWMEDGSPLLVYTRQLAHELEEALPRDYRVVYSMRYGKPSFEEALQFFSDERASEILIVPLYPQYAEASYGTAVAKVFNLLAQQTRIPAVRVVPPFYGEDFFIDSLATIAEEHQVAGFEHVLFSYHGLPEHQVARAGTVCQFSEACCDLIRKENRFCYRAQSFETSRRVAKKLQLPPHQWSVAFQSRLGKRPWIKPYTDLKIEELARKGVKRLAVLCPSFTTDCLETLEEIGERAREDFLKQGGVELKLVPCLNAHPSWVRGLSSYVQRTFPSDASLAVKK